MPKVELSGGPIEYEDTGGDGPVVVMTGGLPMNATLWRGVVAELRPAHRCVVPTMAWGGHRLPMNPDADLSLAGHARLLSEFIERLDLHDVTLVEVDTGMTQLLAGERPDRVGRIVLCSCEAFENYPPGLPAKMLGFIGKLPGGLNFAIQQLRFKPLRRFPLTFGRMAKRPIPYDVSDAWFEPLFTQRAIRRDLTKYLRSVDKRTLLKAAERLPRFDRPALVVWAAEDRTMPQEHGRRLADLFPKGRLIEMPDSGTLIPLDQPVELAHNIRDFVAAGSGDDRSL
jgi:pimeloyl-ACP methyl ester carboxylesterase